MKKLWQKEYSLRGCDMDKFGHIKPSAILEFFQDAAGQHAEELGLGFEAMLKRNYLWVMTRVKFQILSAPKQFQKIVVKTWPLEPNRINYKREYVIEDLNGNVLIRGGSEWVVIDSVKRRFVTVTDLYPFNDGFEKEVMFKEKLQKIRDFETKGEGYFVCAGFSELDNNNHVNNTKYANYIMNAIAPKQREQIESFQIDYRKEVMEGAKLEIFHTREENIIVVKGVNESGEIAFSCKIEYK
ncbi:MAG: hypothetical protein E7537_06740 [Ruminococcaceae bacterium]|nr:hypothetical protein [Oscillospiraceae bacterium]